jgi:Putative MetA-pathway of phenol degradation
VDGRRQGADSSNQACRRAVRCSVVVSCVLGIVLVAPLCAQDLAPRAYLITPVHANAITLTWSFYSGGVDFNNAVPINNAKGTYSVPVFSYYHALNFFGRSANITASLPYGVGTFSGEVGEQTRSVYRSGLLDLSARLSVNLIGGPAMKAPQFVKWKQKRILGASLKVVAPTGQYDPTKLINWSINRWAFKPEIGYSQRFGHWVLDAYAGAWLYTLNSQFYNIPKPVPQSEKPIGSFEGHLSYDFKKLLGTSKFHGWASLDGNFWWGGITALNGIQNPDTRQTSSRIGGTLSVPFLKHQSIKIAYSDGTYVRFGGNYNNVQVAWQYSWLGRPK